MAFSLSYLSRIQITDEFDGSGPVAAGNLRYGGYDRQSTIRSDAVAPAVPVTKFAYFEQALTAGAATIDLTAMTHNEGGTVDGTGLKVQFARFTAPLDNEAAITITPDVTDGYTVTDEHVLQPGQSAMYELAEEAADIASGAKNIDLAGTGTDSLLCTIVMG